MGVAVAAALREGAEVVTVYTALNAVRDLVDPIVKANEGRIATHHADRHLYHAACLAVAISDLIEEEMKA